MVRIEEFDPMKTIGIPNMYPVKIIIYILKGSIWFIFFQTMHDVVAMDDFEVPMESTFQKYIKNFGKSTSWSWTSTLFPDHALRTHAILDDIVLILDLNIHPSFGKGEGHFLKSLLAQTNWQMKWIDQVYNNIFVLFCLFITHYWNFMHINIIFSIHMLETFIRRVLDQDLTYK